MIYTLALRYAKSIFALGIKENELEKYRKELQLVGETFQNSQQLQFVLKNDQITSQKKLQIVKKIFKNQNFSKNIYNFLQVLVINNRFFIFEELLILFEELYCKKKNLLVVLLITSKPLAIDKKEKIKQSLENYFQCIVKLQEKIDSEILGGIVAQVGSYLIDASIKNFLTRIRNSI